MMLVVVVVVLLVVLLVLVLLVLVLLVLLVLLLRLLLPLPLPLTGFFCCSGSGYKGGGSGQGFNCEFPGCGYKVYMTHMEFCCELLK